MTFQEFKNILLSVSPDVYHFESQKKSEYIVWYEIGSIGLSGDNSIVESGAIIAVDYFTKREYSEIPDQITAALDGCDNIAADRPSVIFDEDSKLIHYAWTCEVV